MINTPSKEENGDLVKKRLEKAAAKTANLVGSLIPQQDSSALNDAETLKRKVGRPFKGEVEEYTKEPHVPERRSVLRGFKKFFAKKEFDDVKGNRSKLEKVALEILNGEKILFMKDICDTLNETDLKNI